MVFGAQQHHVRRCPTHFRASHHATEMARLDVLSSRLQAMAHRFFQAGSVTVQAGLDAFLHGIIHGGSPCIKPMNDAESATAIPAAAIGPSAHPALYSIAAPSSPPEGGR